MTDQINSAVQIARLLGCEGFTDYLANQVDKFARRKMTRLQQHNHDKIEEGMREVCSRLSCGDKLVIGKFIALHESMSFTTGLRMGLTACAVKNALDWEKEPWWPNDGAKRRERSFIVEIETEPDEWTELGQQFDSKKDAKLLAYQTALGEGKRTRVRKVSGQIVQSYRDDGTKFCLDLD